LAPGTEQVIRERCKLAIGEGWWSDNGCLSQWVCSRARWRVIVWMALRRRWRCF